MKKNKKKALKRLAKARNTGFSLELELAHRNPKTDHVLGATSKKCLAEIPSGERINYLPMGELQFGREDFMDCVERSKNNLLETKLNFLIVNKLISEELIKWLKDNGYLTTRGVELADRFGAIKSGTTRSGNSLIAPLQAAHKFGVIPKSMLPASSDMDWDAYHNPAAITKEMEDLGLAFLERFNINYEKVYAPQMAEFMKRDMMHTAGYAWPLPQGGIYPRVEYPFNHSFMGYEPLYFAFDNYLDEGKQGDWIKQLAGNYKLIDPSYRLIITLNTDAVKKKLTWGELIRRFFFGRNLL